MNSNLKAKLNSLLLTASPVNGTDPLLPGVIYRVSDDAEFAEAFGRDCESLVRDCFDGKPAKFADWQAGVRPILLEVSPTCDVAQGNRARALVIAGLIVPAALDKCGRKKDAWHPSPVFELRWGKIDFVPQDVSLVFCSRYRTTLSTDAVPGWLDPWFRLRDLPTSALRHWHAGMASRVGYLLV